MILAQIEKNGQTDDLLEKKLQIENMINDTTKAIETVDYRAENRKACCGQAFL